MAEPVQLELQSFVIFDLESTGLRWDRPKITELSMISLERSEFENLCSSSEIRKNCDWKNFPSLNFLVNPQKPINPIASQITGLTNEMLEKYEPFSEKHITQIGEFLDNLPKPIGLVAHNGKSFDFPLLQKELRVFGNISKSLLDQLYCVDSLHGIRSMECSWTKEIHDYINEQKNEKDNETKYISDQKQGNNTLESQSNEPKVMVTRGALKRQLEVAEMGKTEKRRKLSDFCCTTTWSPAKERRMSLKFDSTLNPADEKSEENDLPVKPYRLESIYKDLFQQSPSASHRALDDCISLLKVVLEYGYSFVSYANLKATKFSEVKPMQ